MAVNSVEEIVLAFVTECCGVNIKDGKLEFGTELLFVRRPYHLMDSNYVEVRVVKRHRHLMSVPLRSRGAFAPHFSRTGGIAPPLLSLNFLVYIN